LKDKLLNFKRASRFRTLPCRASASEQGTWPDCARRMSAGKPAPIRRARGSAPRL